MARAQHSERRAAVRWAASIAAAVAILMPSIAWSVNTCTVTAAPHVFNPFDTLNPATGTSPITVTCTHTTRPAVTFSYTIALSTGPGSYAARQLTGTGDTLLYNLYTTSTYGVVWGDGTGATGTVSRSFTVPRGRNATGSRTETVYGRIGGPQNVRPGAYSTASNITVTVTY